MVEAGDTLHLRLALQQRVLPDYRVDFLDELADRCPAGLGVFAGKPRPLEGIHAEKRPQKARSFEARNRHFTNPASPFYLCWQDRIIDWLQSFQPDVLVVEANPRILSTPRAVRWMHARNRPVLGWGLGAPPILGSLSGLRQREREHFLNGLDGWISYSQRGADEYRMMGLDPDRIFVAGNAVASKPEAPPPPKPDVFSGPPVVLFVGRLQRRKRIDYLLQACARLPSSLQPCLEIVGDGPDRSRLELLAERIYPQANFPGAKHGQELAGYFRSADLFVLPGTGGLAVQQAASHGLPLIVAQGDGTQDDLVRAENGWLIPPDEQTALRDALKQALSDPARLRRMGGESYRIAAEEVNIERMADVFIRAALTPKR